MKRTITACAIAIGILLALGLIGLGLWFTFFPNQTIVRNCSGKEVHDLILVIRELHGDWNVERRLDTLEPGARLIVRHSKNDTRAELRYVFEGTLREHEEGYIDLWRGEGWLFDIQADGTVHSHSGYDYHASP